MHFELRSSGLASGLRGPHAAGTASSDRHLLRAEALIGPHEDNISSFKGLQRVLRDDDRIRHFTAARQEANAHGKPRLQTSRNIKHSRGGTRLTAKTRRNGTHTSVYRSAAGELDDGPVAG